MKEDKNEILYQKTRAGKECLEKMHMYWLLTFETIVCAKEDLEHSYESEWTEAEAEEKITRALEALKDKFNETLEEAIKEVKDI